MVFNGHLSVGGKNAMATGFLVGTAASAKGWGEDGYGRVCAGKPGGTAKPGWEAKVVYAL